MRNHAVIEFDRIGICPLWMNGGFPEHERWCYITLGYAFVSSGPVYGRSRPILKPPLSAPR